MKIENVADLQILILAAKEGSLTGAAKILKLTPAAASAMLMRLESQLETKLFVRSTRALRLTSQGQILLKYAEQAFELIQQGENKIGEDQAELSGLLRVTAPVDLTRSVLFPLFDEFLKAHPKVELQLTGTDTRMDLVRSEIDVALRYGKLQDSGLTQRNLATPKFCLAASPAYLKRNSAITKPSDLLQHNCLTFNRAGKLNQQWRFAKKGKWQEVRVHGDRSADEATLAREWAISGAGLVFFSSLNLAEDIKKGRLVQVLEDWETESHPLHAIMPGGRSVPHRVRVFIDYLVQKFSKMN